MSKPPSIIIKSHQFFHACKHILGTTFLTKTFGKSPRQLDRWSADPRFAQDSQNNPIDHLCVILEKLCELGKEDIAMGGVEVLARAINCRVILNGDFQNCQIADKQTLAEECLDDLPSLADYHQALMENQKAEEVRRLLDETIRELEENFQLYLRKQQEEE